MTDIEKVVEESLNELKPSEEEKLEALRIYGEVKDVIERSLQIPFEFAVELHGSVAKGTELRGMIDLDVFILIRYDQISKEWLESEVVKPLFGIFKGIYSNVKLKYATHPYIYINLGRHEVDIVPAYWAKEISEIKTAVDRTPFHTRYVVSRLDERMRDEVRLLKSFFKSTGAYGAEIRVEGFSGYLTELLIIKYKSFLNAVRNIAKWHFGEVIIVDEGTVKVDRNYLRKSSKSPLIVLDPVDPNRNVASAVSAESLAKVVLSSHIFLQKPSAMMLLAGVRSPGVDTIDSLRSYLVDSGREVVGILFKLHGEPIPDVIWGKLKSVARSFINSTLKAGFTVASYSIWCDDVSEAVVMATIMPRELTPYEVHLGPPLGRPADIRSFVLKYYMSSKSLGPYVSSDGRIFALRQRKHVLPYQVAEEYVATLKTGESISVRRVLRNVDEVCEYVKSRGDPELFAVFRKIVKLEPV